MQLETTTNPMSNFPNLIYEKFFYQLQKSNNIELITQTCFEAILANIQRLEKKSKKLTILKICFHLSAD